MLHLFLYNIFKSYEILRYAQDDRVMGTLSYEILRYAQDDIMTKILKG
jgi:hypothetical protein